MELFMKKVNDFPHFTPTLLKKILLKEPITFIENDKMIKNYEATVETLTKTI